MERGWGVNDDDDKEGVMGFVRKKLCLYISIFIATVIIFLQSGESNLSHVNLPEV